MPTDDPIIIAERVAAIVRNRKVSLHKASGRYRVHMDGKHVLYHRIVMTAMLGRPLRQDEFVHHADHNPQNNDPSNLVLMTPAAHMAYHGKMREIQIAATCLRCGKEFTRYPSYGSHHFCSKACYWAGRTETKTCPVCGTVFTRPLSKHATYCSYACSHKDSFYQGDPPVIIRP